jgi:hypothetical protein
VGERGKKEKRGTLPDFGGNRKAKKKKKTHCQICILEIRFQ